MATTKKLTKKQKANRALAAALHAQGLPRSGATWDEAKALVAKGHGCKAAARLVRAGLPAEEQDEAIARKTARGNVAKTLEVAMASITQEDTDAEFSRALEASVRAEAEAIAEEERVLCSRAREVAAGKVMRDARGRLVSRELQREVEEFLLA